MMFLNKISALLYNPLDYIRQIKLRYFLIFAALLAPAFANAANLFDIPAEDVSMKMLRALFGGLIEDGGSGISNDPILEPIKALNSGALIVGGILAAYTILAGTVGTAHDGEMLGKRLSSVWVPIRYSIGTALVLPVISGGYCVIQLLVMWVIMQGIGLAGSVWTAYIGNSADMVPTGTVSLADIGKVEDLSSFIIRSHACNAVNAQQQEEQLVTYKQTAGEVPKDKQTVWGTFNYTQNGQASGKVFGRRSYSYTGTAAMTVINGVIDGYNSVANFFRDKPVSADPNRSNQVYDFERVCGFLNFGYNQTKMGTYNSTLTTQSGYLGTEIATGFAPVDVSAIYDMHKAQTEVLVTSLETDAFAMIAKDDFNEEDAVKMVEKARSFASEYASAIQTAANGVQGTDAWQAMKDAASNQGWMMAGAWFTRIVIINNTIRSAMDAFPTFNDSWMYGKINIWSWITDADYRKQIAKISLVSTVFGTQGSIAAAKELATKRNEENVKNDQANRSETGFFSGLLEDMFHGVAKAITGIDMTEIQNDNRHPVIILSELGHNLTRAVAIMTVSVTIVGIASNSLLTTLNLFFGLPLTSIIIMAFTAEFVIPTLPYIIWIGAIVGWLLLVVEAIIAAPLWAIMHLHPNGDDLTGRGGDGYKLVLSLIFRPVLMVFGMIGAILISSIIGEFINKTFYSVFRNSVQNSTGISAFAVLIMGIFLYISLMFTFVKKTFSIIHLLPDQLMRWMGGSTGGLGDMASGFQESAEKTSQGAAALAGASVSGVTKGAATVMSKGTKFVGSKGEMGSSRGVAEKTGVAGFMQKVGYRAAKMAGADVSKYEVDDPNGKSKKTFYQNSAGESKRLG